MAKEQPNDVSSESVTMNVHEDSNRQVKDEKKRHFNCIGTITNIFIGIPFALLIFLFAFCIGPALYLLYIFGLTIFCILSPFFQLRTWLGFQNEIDSYVNLLRLEFGKDSFFRKYIKTLKKIKEIKNDKEYDGPIKRLVKAQIKSVRALIHGGNQFIEVKDTMSLGSVVVSTIFFFIYVVHFASNDFEIKAVNSKMHDALAIILPLLLTEELAAGMSEVLLWMKWTKVSKMISDPFQIEYVEEEDEYSSDEEYKDEYQDRIEDEEEEIIKETKEIKKNEGKTIQELKKEEILKKQRRLRAKIDFTNKVNKQCHHVGVGATDMTGIASFLASLWTLLFLFQGYVVDILSNNLNNLKQDEIFLYIKMYWICGIYSFLIILFCYLPFFNTSSEKKKMNMKIFLQVVKVFY